MKYKQNIMQNLKYYIKHEHRTYVQAKYLLALDFKSKYNKQTVIGDRHKDRQ